ncbi:hypothetical protein [Eleftheria terrae]|uniref:hypothetical protein n=1 Tax=Eleftheria terrae TaxID=1597781 RepID=UPI00263BB2D3|nr:hypothetical protein [Eleftheria terrae]WKB53938.1 hypothetical protein N7L95_05995 [Eleftheria terrae]
MVHEELPTWVLEAMALLIGGPVNPAVFERWYKRALRDSSHRYVTLQAQFGTVTYVVDRERQRCFADPNGSALHFQGAVLTLEGDESRFQPFPAVTDLYTVDLASGTLAWQDCPHTGAMQDFERFTNSHA